MVGPVTFYDSNIIGTVVRDGGTGCNVILISMMPVSNSYINHRVFLGMLPDGRITTVFSHVMSEP